MVELAESAAALCLHTGERLALSKSDEVFLEGTTGELTRVATCMPGEIAWTAQGRRVRFIGRHRTADDHDAQHGLAALETGTDP